MERLPGKTYRATDRAVVQGQVPHTSPNPHCGCHHRTVRSDAVHQRVPERAHAAQSLTELFSGSLWVVPSLPGLYLLAWHYWGEKNLSQGRSAPWTATSSLPGPKRKFQQSPFPQAPFRRNYGQTPPGACEGISYSHLLTPQLAQEQAQLRSFKCLLLTDSVKKTSASVSQDSLQFLPLPVPPATPSTAPAWPIQWQAAASPL